MISKNINDLKKSFKKLKIDAYIIPKNDEFFSEYSKNDKLKKISNFSGSAGYAVISKKKNYLWPRWTASNLTKKKFYRMCFVQVPSFSLTTVATNLK